jgi:hypothetical protein
MVKTNTTMRRKTMSMHFLHLGSLFILALVMVGCKGNVDARVIGDWVFENASPHKIEVVSKNFNSFVIEPGESYTYSDSGEGPENVTPDDYLSPYREGDKIIYNDVITHLLQKEESITDVRNFTSEKVSARHYRFTYIFTDNDYPVE